MDENRKLAVQPPPSGFVWIEDYRTGDGSVHIPGIASRLGISPSTYRKWRMRDEGPDTVRIGKKIAARITAIEDWLRSLERAATQERAASRAVIEHSMRPAEPRRLYRPRERHVEDHAKAIA
ncbi:helix-turn-helix transcriptional regulator [Streptomyces sp. NPDC001515]